jgi:hypothetical protein
VAVDKHLALRGIDDPANDADQRGLARAVRPEQREDFSAPDGEIDVLERLKPDA